MMIKNRFIKKKIRLILLAAKYDFLFINLESKIVEMNNNRE